MQPQGLVPRASRKTTSCTECRRRKQKCNQGNPCNNCKRRFPQPTCEYGPRHDIGDDRSPLSQFPVYLPRTKPRAFLFDKRVRPLNSSRHRNRIPVDACKALHPSRTESLPHRQDITAELTGDFSFVEQRHLSESSYETTSRSGDASSPDEEERREHRAQNLWHLSGHTDGLGQLPIEPTKQNAVLIQTFSQVLNHFKGSFDGVPDADNPFLLHYVPWCVQSPLLVHSSLYIAARSLVERNYIDERTTTQLKVFAISRLNEHLRSADCTNDEAIGAVVQFTSIEIFFGHLRVMQTHLKGLREMVRLRGGLPNHGVGGLVSRVALVDDCLISLAYETPPVLQQSADFGQGLDSGRPEVTKVSFSSPFIVPLVPFRDCCHLLGLHPSTASILDDVSFLVDTVNRLSDNPNPEELRKTAMTAAFVHDRIARLPASDPAAKQGRAAGDDGEHNQGSEAGDSPTPHSLLPEYPEFESSKRKKSGNCRVVIPDDIPDSPSPTDDALYTAVRQAALVYARAIGSHQPLSSICSADEALSILMATWRVPLARWRGIVGIFIFIMAAIAPTVTHHSGAAACGRGNDDASRIDFGPHAGFVKSILQIGLMQMSLESWSTCKNTMQRALRLQSWLTEGSGQSQGE